MARAVAHRIRVFGLSGQEGSLEVPAAAVPVLDYGVVGAAADALANGPCIVGRDACDVEQRLRVWLRALNGLPHGAVPVLDQRRVSIRGPAHGPDVIRGRRTYLLQVVLIAAWGGSVTLGPGVSVPVLGQGQVPTGRVAVAADRPGIR